MNTEERWGQRSKREWKDETAAPAVTSLAQRSCFPRAPSILCPPPPLCVPAALTPPSHTPLSVFQSRSRSGLMKRHDTLFHGDADKARVGRRCWKSICVNCPQISGHDVNCSARFCSYLCSLALQSTDEASTHVLKIPALGAESLQELTPRKHQTGFVLTSCSIDRMSFFFF